MGIKIRNMTEMVYRLGGISTGAAAGDLTEIDSAYVVRAGRVNAIYGAATVAPSGGSGAHTLALTVNGSEVATVVLANTIKSNSSTGLSLAVKAGDVLGFNVKSTAATAGKGLSLTVVVNHQNA